MTSFKYSLFLILLSLLVACGGESAQPAVSSDNSAETAPETETTSTDESGEEIVESITGILGGTADDSIDNETDAAMAEIESQIDEREDAAQNDANTGGDASDEFATPTVIEPGSYTGAATFGLDSLSLDMRDIYRVNAKVGDIVRVTIDNSQTEFPSRFQLYINDKSFTFGDSVDAGSSETIPVGMPADGHVDIELSAQSYAFTVEIAAADDGGSGGDAGDTPKTATAVTGGETSGVLEAATSAEPARDCYAHAGAEVTYYAPEGQPRKPTITARTFAADGNQLKETVAYYGGTNTFNVAADPEAVAICFTAALNGSADLLYSHYVFTLGAAPDAAVADVQADVTVDVCQALVEVIQTTLSIDSAADVNLRDNGGCEYAFNESAITLSYFVASEDDMALISFMEPISLDTITDGLYVDLGGQSILQWSADTATYQLIGLDLINGTISAKQLLSIAQAINP